MFTIFKHFHYIPLEICRLQTLDLNDAQHELQNGLLNKALSAGRDHLHETNILGITNESA